jgi:UDP-glucose 4-epimerase
METPECIGQVINLGSTDEISIRDLAFTVIEVLGSKSELQFVPYREVYGNGFDDMQRRVPDLSRAKSLIDFKPRVKLKNTILRTAHYLNENRST